MSGPVPVERRTGGMVVLLIVGTTIFLLWKVHELMLVAFIAVLLSVYLDGFTTLWLRVVPRMPRGIALTLSTLATIAALAGIVVLLLPAVLLQTGDLVRAVPRYLAALDTWLQRVAGGSQLFRDTGLATPGNGIVSQGLSDAAEFIRRSMFSYATGTGMVIIDAIAVIAMSFYISMFPAPYRSGVVTIVPPRYRAMTKAILADLVATLRSWVGAQLLAMVVLAATTAIGLLLLDVPYWLAFSIFAGVAVMVPFFGTITSTLLPALLVLPDRGPLAAFLVAMVGVVVHLVEANVVHPLIMQHRVALPPALTIIGVLIMGALAGLLGMVVAVPLLATIVVLVRHIVIFQTYGERPDDVTQSHAVLKPVRLSSGSLPAVSPAP